MNLLIWSPSISWPSKLAFEVRVYVHFHWTSWGGVGYVPLRHKSEVTQHQASVDGAQEGEQTQLFSLFVKIVYIHAGCWPMMTDDAPADSFRFWVVQFYG